MDSTINWAEGQAPSSINDSARAMMAATAKYRDDIAGAIVTGGTSTAYTVTSYEVFSTLALMNGQAIAFTVNATNGATVTLNVDGLGAKPLRSATGVELAAGALVSGASYSAVYNNSDAAFYLRDYTPTIIAANQVVTASITAASVTYAKIQNVAATRLLGNPTGGAAVTSEISVTGPLAFSGTALTLGATTTAHGVALFEGAASMGNTGTGTIGQALISGGASADPSFQSGAWVLLNTLTASSSATLTDTTSLTSTYSEYELVFESILPATNNVDCRLRVNVGGVQSTSYVGNAMRWNSATTGSGGVITYIPLSSLDASLPNTIGSGLNGKISVQRPSGTSASKVWNGQFGAHNMTSAVVFGVWTGSTAAITGFQVDMTSGNITSGVIRVYGRL